ncbi:hypothetical protein [Aquimarina longa]|uniref:hypothetical protein n=1 Tax=Aquimarina longa TaxID=1080221 RepID=UPI000782BD81|nr:hypothetical protein [Aquimarina longa]
MKKHIIIPLLILGISCSNSNKKNDTKSIKYNVLSSIIDKFGQAQIPPPFPGENINFTSQQLDSIRNQKQKIALYPIFIKSNENIDIKYKKDDLFNQLLQNLKNIEDSLKIEPSKIRTKIQHDLSILDTIKNKTNKHYISYNYDKLISLSPIVFNKNYNKAIVLVGVKIGYLNSGSSIVFLEKKNGTWRIVYSKEFEVS